MSFNLTIALDAMGGDHGIDAVIPGADLALKTMPDLRFLIFGDEGRIRPVLARYPNLRARADVIHTDKAVSNEDKPAVALRTGRQSSMRLAIDAVKQGRADCVVSSGNTGALMAMAKMVLKCLPSIHRPAIASVLPTIARDTVVLDLGANLVCDTEMLTQLAVLGAVYARVVEGIDAPRIGVLNIGTEDMKGGEVLRETASVLSKVKLPGKFIGFVEGDDITKGTADVIVTDGFTGNIALKTAEGVAKMSEFYMRRAFKSSIFAMLGAMLAYRSFKKVKKELDPRYYNGGMFLGLDGICVKSHGGSDHIGFANAIKVAAELAHHGFNDRVAYEIEQLMSQESFFISDLADEESM